MLFFRITLLLSCHSFAQAIPSLSFFYPKNLTASTCTDKYSWTTWFNSAKPTSEKDFDQESLSIIQRAYGRDICATPQGMQARTVTALQTGVSYGASWKTSSGMISAFLSQTAGVDFQVRFCCANGDFVATTTAAPRPIDSRTCGRAKVKPSISFMRIFGGSRAVPHSWPWQVLYEERRLCEPTRICIDICGGTLVDPYHVLTAAHCIKGKDMANILITAGAHHRQNGDPKTRQERSVHSVFLHPEWSRETLENDLAIVRLSKPVQFNDYVQPACLPGSDPLPNSSVILIGWGADRMDGSPSDELKQAQVKVIGDCQQYWNPFDEDAQICVGQMLSGDSACQGDSGSPLLQEYNGQWVVQGVASFVDDCKTGEGFLPNVYVRVSTYLTWIHSIIH